MRSREWRRRIGGACTPGQTFDGGVSANDDDAKYQDPAGYYPNQSTPDCPGGYAGGLDASWRFLNVTIPVGARIDVAYCRVYTHAIGDDGAGTTTLFYGEDADDAGQTTSRADWAGRSRTTASVAWDDQNFSTGYTNTPSLVDIIQEIVDRGGWSSGNAMHIFWEDNGSTANNWYRHTQFDNGSNEPLLHVEYCA